MNVAGVGKLNLSALASQQWHHAVPQAYAHRPLAWSHTRSAISRFKPIGTTFPLLYFAPDPVTALFEVQALLGHPRIGPVLLNASHWHVAQVSIQLGAIADLASSASERAAIDTTVQELTGDWADYGVRTTVSGPVQSNPPAPTQALGESLYMRGNCQGFLAPSAKNSVFANLVVFPDRVGIDHQGLTIGMQTST